MKNPRPTFKEILKNTEREHSERLMRKARRANRIAKTLRGRRRQIAYGVKHQVLRFLVEKMPGRTYVRPDLALTDFVVIELKETRSGLHYPAAQI
jgi:hypothetical protein